MGRKRFNYLGIIMDTTTTSRSQAISQKTILKKIIQVASSTLISRIFGIIREVLMVRYLGATGLSDAFLTAFKIPNSLRKIFAEGALSAAFVPTIVSRLHHKDRHEIAGIMSLAFIIFEGVVLLLCGLIMYYAEYVLRFIAPGFTDDQICHAIPMLHILAPFIFFISSSALLAGPLNAVGHFFVPAFAPILINIIFIGGIIACLWATLPVTTLCWFILCAGFAHFFLHIITYRKHGFSFGLITKQDGSIFYKIIIKFLLCLPSISLMEIALFIDTSFASLLVPGSISLLFYATRFVCIPLGVFAVAFSTILLPHFSRVQTYSLRRLHFYLFESAKLILWITMPVALLMAFFSHEIFLTIFLSKKFTILQVGQAARILCVLLIGLFFFSFNKIILNIFYAMHAAWIPAIISLTATLLNIVLNMLFIQKLQTIGLAMATVLSSITQTVLFLIILHKKYRFRIYLGRFIQFCMRSFVQLLSVGSAFLVMYYASMRCITYIFSERSIIFLTQEIGLWLWISPVALIAVALLYYSRSL